MSIKPLRGNDGSVFHDLINIRILKHIARRLYREGSSEDRLDLDVKPRQRRDLYRRGLVKKERRDVFPGLHPGDRPSPNGIPDGSTNIPGRRGLRRGIASLAAEDGEKISAMTSGAPTPLFVELRRVTDHGDVRLDNGSRLIRDLTGLRQPARRTVRRRPRTAC